MTNVFSGLRWLFAVGMACVSIGLLWWLVFHPAKANRLFLLPETDGLPIWSADTKVNRIACNRQYKEVSNGWVIKQWKNQDSLCNDKDSTPLPDCAGAASELSTNTSRYCHWKEEKKLLLSIDAGKMENQGCNPNAKGNVGGFVSYLAWEPKILPDFFKQQQRYMLRNIEDIKVRFRFHNLKVEDSFICDESKVDQGAVHKRAIVHSYATATFSEIDPKTKRGTGRTIFYQILNYDARPKVQEAMLLGRHGYLTCNYKNNQHSTMIYRDTVLKFGQAIALPPSEGRDEFVDYELSLLQGMKKGLKKCYGDIDPGNFKFTGFHVGTEIKNGAKHEFMIQDPQIEITYSRNQS